MKKIRLMTLAVSSVLFVSSARAVDFADIQFWVGNGANQAALVIDWNDTASPESLIWGFRWDGSATGLDMLQAIVSADSRLFAHISPPGDWGVSVYGIGYDLNANHTFGVSPSLVFNSGGIAVSNSPDDTRVATENGDRWAEGWNSGFWGYYVKPSSGAAWEVASTGPSGRLLADGVWDGFSFAPGFAFTDPSEPSIAPIPEPGTLSILLAAGTLLVCGGRRLL